MQSTTQGFDICEERARAMTPAQIGKRLKEARSRLCSDLRKRFGKGERVGTYLLVSDDGTLALEWRVRLNPNAPISYDNQQTSCGTVIVVEAD